MLLAHRLARLGNDMMQWLPTVQCSMDSIFVRLQGSTSIAVAITALKRRHKGGIRKSEHRQ